MRVSFPTYSSSLNSNALKFGANLTERTEPSSTTMNPQQKLMQGRGSRRMPDEKAERWLERSILGILAIAGAGVAFLFAQALHGSIGRQKFKAPQTTRSWVNNPLAGIG